MGKGHWRKKKKLISLLCNPLNLRKMTGTKLIFHVFDWHSVGLPWWLSCKESTCQCSRQEFTSWSWKIPRAVEQLSHNYRAHAYGARELQLLSPRASTSEVCAPQSLCSATREAPTVRSPCPQLESSPCSLQSKKSLSFSEDPAQLK